jgi:SAM-dependent methyltransferase
VDLAENLLDLARKKAKQQGLENISFRKGDMLDLGFADLSFDAVICVFGIFFVPDMHAAVRELWRLVGPGGKLAVTTWGPRLFETASTAFWDAIRAVRPELYKGFNPWDRIADADSVRALFAAAEVDDVEVIPEAGSHPLSSPEDWWYMVLGSGYRGTVEQLSVSDQERVRLEVLDFVRRRGLRSVEANVVYAVAVRSRS